MALLEVDDLSVDYDGAPALVGLSLCVEPNEIVALVGSNGAGKSTLLKAISGLKRASAGQVRFQGRDILGLPAHDVTRRGISLVPEGRRLFPRLPVWRNLQLGAYLRPDPAFRRETVDFIHSLFPVLSERRFQLAGTLSGGEQQMLAIGRALMSGPSLLLLDEPSLGIAPQLVQRIFASLADINRREIAIVLVEQRVQQALHLASRGYVLQTGRLTLAGPSTELLNSEDVRRSYLGL